MSGDMLRTGIYCELVTIFLVFGSISTEYPVFNNGWIPVSPQKVYDQTKRHTSNNFQMKSKSKISNVTFHSWGQTEAENKEDVYFGDDNSLDPITFQLKNSEFEENKINNKDIYRKAKKIVERNINDNVFFLKGHKNEDMSTTSGETINSNIKFENINKTSQKSIVQRDSTNTYEVTEDPNTDINHYTEYHYTDLNKDRNIGYKYGPTKDDFKSKLFEILSKYNIKTTDRLQNYQLSRHNRDQIPLRQNHQIPIVIPYRYNSPNHLPVDPVLAVILSNYGIYLPGLYGINGHYNNFYGYLASNNFHNNKPFGLYKIFSDTDSSN